MLTAGSSWEDHGHTSPDQPGHDVAPHGDSPCNVIMFMDFYLCLFKILFVFLDRIHAFILFLLLIQGRLMGAAGTTKHPSLSPDASGRTPRPKTVNKFALWIYLHVPTGVCNFPDILTNSKHLLSLCVSMQGKTDTELRKSRLCNYWIYFFFTLRSPALHCDWLPPNSNPTLLYKISFL